MHDLGQCRAIAPSIQDIWIKVLRGIVTLRDGGKLRPWLFGIAYRVLMDRLRKLLSFCSAATAGSLYLALARDLPAARPAAIAFFAMALAAVILLARARRDYNRLLAHKLALERRLGRADGAPRA